MEVDFRHAKRVAAGCLAMTTCACALWLNQGQMYAATESAAPVTQTTTAPSQTKSPAADQQPEKTTTPAKPTEGEGTKNPATPTPDQKPAAPVINQQDQAEHGNLDQLTISQTGQVTAQGWQATNQAQDKPYHYVITYDPVHQVELGRINVTDQTVARPDVAKAFPGVYQAAKAGFNVTFNLGSRVDGLSQIQIISRYTADPAGNGNPADIWFAPVTIDRQNRAWLDQVTVKNDQLHVAGWNATAAMMTEPTHYLILFDRTTNRELARQEVKNLNRPDVARALPGVPGAGQSGFSADFSLEGVNLGHQLQLVSRYTRSKDGNSNYTDYWLNLTTGQEQNQGYLDSVNLSDGSDLVASGWHASNLAGLEDNHFLILFDQTAGQQVAVVTSQAVARSDVAKAYPAIAGAGQSGFTAKFSLKGLTLKAGHQYSLVSRYSTSAKGNGGAGQYTDFWSNPVTFNQQAAYLDHVQMTSKGLNLSGWMASDQALFGESNPYLIVVDTATGKELLRTKLNLTARPDVAKAMPALYNSGRSGFSAVVPMDPTKYSSDLLVVLRFSDAKDGEGHYTNVLQRTFATSAANFDQLQVSNDNNGLYVSGWHASNQVADKPYQFLIFIDTATGKEVYRQAVPDANRGRADVARAYPAIMNAGQSGYQLGLAMPAQLKGKTVGIIHRYSDDKAGNGNYVDAYSNPVTLGDVATGLQTAWQTVLNHFSGQAAIAIQLAKTGQVIALTTTPSQRFVTASSVKVALLTKLLHDQGGWLSADQQSLATRMIRNSDNDAAAAIYQMIGGAAGLAQLFRDLGMNESVTSFHWGWTQTTPADQLKLLNLIYLNPGNGYITPGSRDLIRNLMTSVTPSQTWGISAGSTNFAIKDGWNQTDGLWNTSSIGDIPGAYTIAVYTRQATMAAGQDVIAQLAQVTRQMLG